VISLVAISDSSAPPPSAPLRTVSAGSLCALCVPADERDVTVDMLVDREELLEALMEDRDVLPVQFGTALPDERAAARMLLERHDELAAALDRVRGAVELGLRARLVGPAGGERVVHASGRDYLRAHVGNAGAARRLHGRLGAISRSAVVRSGPDLLRAAYLVDRAAVAGFVAEVRRTQESSPELSLLCTGPWPPFSFASAEPTS
jgi:Gas vesicle synthesis protein GvpL/GvpF